jgi:predicted dehydrogenase
MLTRRTLLGATTALLTSCASTSRRRRPSPNEQLDIACIGVANRAAANLGGVSSQNIVALCDVDENYLGAAGEKFPRASRYVDYREMLERERLDAVVVSTADHTHAPATLMALDLGLDVYCEKPLTHSVVEARRVAERARSRRAVTQMGTQIHATDNYRRVVELVQSGAIGDVHTCHAWVGKAWGGGERPTDTPPVPPHLHYDLWLGPAPYRPYHPTYLPANWRRWWDFGGGTLGDMGCHLIDLAYWALDLDHPTYVSAEGPEVSVETAPLWMRARWEFGARKGHATPLSGGPRSLGPVTLHWHDGGALPPELQTGAVERWDMGVLFVGSEGLLLADYGRHLLYPQEKFAEHVAPEPWIPSSLGHYEEWIEACKTRGPTTCAFGYSGPLTETVLLGNVAYRAGTGFAWDASKLRASEAEAQALLERRYRPGWGAGRA